MEEEMKMRNFGVKMVFSNVEEMFSRRDDVLNTMKKTLYDELGEEFERCINKAFEDVKEQIIHSPDGTIEWECRVKVRLLSVVKGK